MSDELIPLDPKEGVKRYLDRKESGVRHSTYQKEKSRLNDFIEWCDHAGIDNLNDLNGRLLSDFVRWRQGEVKPITLQKQLSSPRQALRFWADIDAVEQGLAEKLHAPEVPDGAKSKDVHLDADRAERILDELEEFRYASREHVLVALAWGTGMRRGALRAIDVDDLYPDELAVELVHRPEQGTQLKNGEDGERFVYLGKLYQVVDDHLRHPDRHDVLDEYGREPLFTTPYGRASETTIYDAIHRATQPCRYGMGNCPHDRDPRECEAVGSASVPCKCPSSRSPHALRRGYITNQLKDETPPDAISERADVSLEVLYEHYDARNARERMNTRKGHFEDP